MIWYDLQLYGKNSDQLDELLHTVRTFSDDIQMKFGLDKCAVSHFFNGRLSEHNSGVTVGKSNTINCLEPGQVYKYLGVDDSNGIQQRTMRERLRREYFRRVKLVLQTELYGRNNIPAINGFALPVLNYGFGVIHWECTDLQQLDRRTRKLVSMHGVHHPAADVDRLYAPCSDGDRGLQQIESTYQSCIARLNCYLADSSDRFMQTIRECDSGKSSHSIKRMACRFTSQLRRSLASDEKSQKLHRKTSISVEDGFEQAPKTDARYYRTCCSSIRVRSWNGKPMHAQEKKSLGVAPVPGRDSSEAVRMAVRPVGISPDGK